MFNQEAKEIFDKIMKPENALDILERALSNVIVARSCGKTMLKTMYDLSILRAMESLKKEIEINKTASCDHLNKNHIFVSQDVYYQIMDNPDGVIFESAGQPPIRLTWDRVEDDEDETYTNAN